MADRAYAMAIMVLSVAPTNFNKQVNLSGTWVLRIRSDYLLHMLLFLPWMILISWRWKEKQDAKFFLKALAAGLMLAAFSEMIQLGVPGRAFNPVDLLANWSGVVIGALVVKGMEWREAL